MNPVALSRKAFSGAVPDSAASRSGAELLSCIVLDKP
jgi:hypothetical protein